MEKWGGKIGRSRRGDGGDGSPRGGEEEFVMACACACVCVRVSDWVGDWVGE